MFFVIFLCFYFVFGDLQEVTLPVYTPPSQESMMNKYFHTPEPSETNRSKKSILSVSDSFYKTIETMKKELSTNISNLQRELHGKNVTGGDDRVNVSGAMQEYIRTGVFKNFLSVPIEPTTYKYPTAVWSSQNYEKLKNQKYRPRNASRIFVSRPVINPAYVPLERGTYFSVPDKPERRSRGKTKWKDTKSSEIINSDLVGDQDYVKSLGGDFVDRFLEQSLTKYIMSSHNNVGNVSVKTFSEILKNITDQKPKRLQSPYDENKELRMKFREEVILKKKNDTRTHGRFLEKQLQRRLEKVQDVFNEKDKDKILANMWKYSTLNRTTDSLEDKKPKSNYTTEENTETTSALEAIAETTPITTITTTQLYNDSLIYITTEKPEPVTRHTTESNRGTIKFYLNRTKYETTESSRKYNYGSSEQGTKGSSSKNSFRLTAEESSYYRKGHFPTLTFIGQPDKPGVIPGRPRIDYPVHSFPPATKFKCPKFKGGKPRMMADPETRCQVFYICTGDGPTTAMLCPNGTMFNENFLVCDWWYNVNC